MTPLADTHVHLLAGRDDGPLTLDEALAMCRMLVSEGARHATALAHQNRDYPDNSADPLRAAAAELASCLAARQIPLSVYPTGEVMLTPSTVEDWKAGKLLSVGDRGQWLLVEMPHDAFVDLLPIAAALRPLGVRPIVAHAERYPELLDDPARTAQWIEAGCLIQVTARALAEPWDTGMEQALKQWVTGGFVHLLGSDGHGIDRRRPILAAGFARLAKWAGRSTAERIASLWGVAVLQGLPVNVPPPQPPARSWFTRLFGR
jgi:protein-tyrosine phosphatase